MPKIEGVRQPWHEISGSGDASNIRLAKKMGLEHLIDGIEESDL